MWETAGSLEHLLGNSISKDDKKRRKQIFKWQRIGCVIKMLWILSPTACHNTQRVNDSRQTKNYAGKPSVSSGAKVLQLGTPTEYNQSRSYDTIRLFFEFRRSRFVSKMNPSLGFWLDFPPSREKRQMHQSHFLKLMSGTWDKSQLFKVYLPCCRVYFT